MTPPQHILHSLQTLSVKKTAFIDGPENLVPIITQLLLSKKFRKYAVTPEYKQHIEQAILLKVQNQQPINLTFLQGAYKLWRLEEAPEADWAELFAVMYYSKWVKAICEVYQPGVWFDFFMDDLIVPIINNLTLKEVAAYINSFQDVLDFLKPFQPANLKMTITTVGDQFESPQAFELSLQKNIAALKQKKPVFTQRQLEMVELNVRPSPEQLADPHWREKVRLVHDSYSPTKREPGYHYRPDKILVFTQPLPAAIAVGTTKTSVAKHWCGVGALKKNGDSYQEYVLSPKQLATTNCSKVGMAIGGLPGLNFETLRVF